MLYEVITTNVGLISAHQVLGRQARPSEEQTLTVVVVSDQRNRITVTESNHFYLASLTNTFRDCIQR